MTLPRYLAVNNTGGAYSFTGIMTPPSTTMTITARTNPSPTACPLVACEEQIHLSTGFSFNGGAASRNIFLVQYPITYLCDKTAGTIVRYWNYTIAAAQTSRNTNAKLISAGASSSQIATDVSNCTLTAGPLMTTTGQLAIINVLLATTGGDPSIPADTLPVFFEAATKDAP